jgi:hypothetical protein
MGSLETMLLQKLCSNGWTVWSDSSGLSAQREGLLSKWFLGKRSIKLRLDLKFDALSKTVFLSEGMIEEKSGLPPPARKVVLDFGNAKQWIEQQCKSLGWGFKLK